MLAVVCVEGGPTRESLDFIHDAFYEQLHDGDLEVDEVGITAVVSRKCFVCMFSIVEWRSILLPYRTCRYIYTAVIPYVVHVCLSFCVLARPIVCTVYT